MSIILGTNATLTGGIVDVKSAVASDDDTQIEKLQPLPNATTAGANAFHSSELEADFKAWLILRRKWTLI